MMPKKKKMTSENKKKVINELTDDLYGTDVGEPNANGRRRRAHRDIHVVGILLGLIRARLRFT